MKLIHALALLALAAAAHGDPFPGYDDLRRKAAAAWKDAPAKPAAYLVLLPEGSPLADAAKLLAEHRRAEIVPFSPQRPEALLRTLIRKGARYVAIFVEPKEMDVNLVRTFIVLSTLMDEDPFCDFAFGFFTGSTPEKTREFAARSIHADRAGVNRHTAHWSAGANISHCYKDSSFIEGVPGDSWYANLGDLEYARKALPQLQGAGFVHIGGCADPEGIWVFSHYRNLAEEKHWPFDPKKIGQDPKGEMPRITAADFDGIKFDGAVVWTHCCHIGSVDRMWIEGDIVSTFGRCDRVEEYRIPPERSVALAILDAGVAAYIAPLGPNHGMQANSEQYFAAETGAPLGDVLRHGYHDIVMDTDGHPERIGLYVTGKPASWDPDDFVNYNSPHNRALYGDPLLRPFGDTLTPATVETTKTDTGYTFRVTRSGFHGRTWYGNRSAELGRVRIYEVLPVRGRKVTLGEAKGRVPRDREFPITKKTALLERIDGETFLHLQLVTADTEALRTDGAIVEVAVAVE